MTLNITPGRFDVIATVVVHIEQKEISQGDRTKASAYLLPPAIKLSITTNKYIVTTRN